MEIRALARGPDLTATRYHGYLVNGYKFRTLARDEKRKTQCSGVTLTAFTTSVSSNRDPNPVKGNVTYFGAIEEIIKLDYYGQFQAVLFRCRWFHSEKADHGKIRVNFKRVHSKNDPFVLASQAHQVFYVKDGRERDWYWPNDALPRDLFDLNEDNDFSGGATYWNEPAVVANRRRRSRATDDNGDISWCRDDIPAAAVELPSNVFDNNEPPPEDAFGDDDIEDDTLWDYHHSKA